MSESRDDQTERLFRIDISDDDLYEAMKDIPGYLDITPGDLKEVYLHAYRHAFERITHSVKAADIMTRKVHTVRKETPLKEVTEIMASNEISGVPVVDDDMHVIGVISEKDFCTHMGDRRAKSLMAVIAECVQNRNCLAMTIQDQRAEDIMSSPAITVNESSILSNIISLLTGKNINRLPVIDSQNRLIGIISRADIVRASFERLGLKRPAPEKEK